MKITSRSMVLPVENVDTDQIIPARFLTTTERTGLGKYAFADWRYLADGRPNPDFLLNRPDAAGAQILVAGRNFACGSSREHAPWALLDAGIKAVISCEIADIFRSNALKNGLIAAVVDAQTHAELLATPSVMLTVDVAECCVVLPDGRRAAFALDPFSRHCLLNGVDQLGYILSRSAEIDAFEAARRAA